MTNIHIMGVSEGDEREKVIKFLLKKNNNWELIKYREGYEHLDSRSITESN